MSQYATLYYIKSALLSEAATIKAGDNADERQLRADQHARTVLSVALALARTVPAFNAAEFVRVATDAQK